MYWENFCRFGWPPGNREIVQVLTVAPETWSIKKVANLFNFIEYAAHKARNLIQEKGILALGDKKRGKKIDLKVQFIWLKHSMKMVNFLNKFLEKKIMLVLPAIPTNKNS